MTSLRISTCHSRHKTAVYSTPSKISFSILISLSYKITNFHLRNLTGNLEFEFLYYRRKLTPIYLNILIPAFNSLKGIPLSVCTSDICSLIVVSWNFKVMQKVSVILYMATTSLGYQIIWTSFLWLKLGLMLWTWALYVNFLLLIYFFLTRL